MESLSPKSDKAPMVMVPRAVADAYYYQPWSRVVAAAQAGENGLQVRRPRWTPWRRGEPQRAAYLDVNVAQYEEDHAAWAEERDVCFLRQADAGWPPDTTLLYQQHWDAR